MAIPGEVIATPRKGKAPKVIQRDNKSGRIEDRKTGSPGRNVKPRDKRLVAKVTGARNGTPNRTEMISSVKHGLKFAVVAQLEEALDATQKELSELLCIPVSTLRRRKDEGRLQPDESDRVVRFAQLKDAAVELMQGDDKAAVAWLRSPLPILGSESPLQHAMTELGARDVDDLILRLKHGVFS